MPFHRGAEQFMEALNFVSGRISRLSGGEAMGDGR